MMALIFSELVIFHRVPDGFHVKKGRQIGAGVTGITVNPFTLYDGPPTGAIV